jgi:hypothetical protein
MEGNGWWSGGGEKGGEGGQPAVGREWMDERRTVQRKARATWAGRAAAANGPPGSGPAKVTLRLLFPPPTTASMTDKTSPPTPKRVHRAHSAKVAAPGLVQRRLPPVQRYRPARKQETRSPAKSGTNARHADIARPGEHAVLGRNHVGGHDSCPAAARDRLRRKALLLTSARRILSTMVASGGLTHGTTID